PHWGHVISSSWNLDITNLFTSLHPIYVSPQTRRLQLSSYSIPIIFLRKKTVNSLPKIQRFAPLCQRCRSLAAAAFKSTNERAPLLTAIKEYSMLYLNSPG
ncbi:hypothetical protein, partial [Megasphaera stantonii]|uniref:hypothetical protein n=1 Tax=Megasphaera stantonii TaxID=2144175 RepID=UPI001E5396E7